MTVTNNKIKVANVIVNLALGGIERVSLHLCAHLDANRFDPVLVCIGGGGPLEAEAAEYGVRVVKLNKNLKNVPGAVRALSGVLRELEVDVVHGNPGLVARLAAPKGTAVVSTYHNMLLRRGYLSLLPDRYLAGKTDSLVAITKAVAANAERTLRLRPGKFRVIYNGIDVKRIQRLAAVPNAGAAGDGAPTVSDGAPTVCDGAPTVCDGAPAVCDGAPAVCYLGRLVQEKGVGTLIKAFSEVGARLPGAALWIIGDGPERTRLEQLAAGLGGKARFYGSTLNPYPTVAASLVFCLPAYAAGFELAILEAMALGKPIVTTRAGGIPEVIGDAGLLVAPGDARALAQALIAVVTDPAKAAELSAKARARAELFDIKKTASEYGKIYEEVVRLKKK